MAIDTCRKLIALGVSHVHRLEKLPSIKFEGHRKRYASSFDVFDKIKDPPEVESSGNLRKPSNKVIALVDDIMTLTLIEAADLCDLCQERLSERAFSARNVPGRTPFPHPATMFSGFGFPVSPIGLSSQASQHATVPGDATPAPSTPSTSNVLEKPSIESEKISTDANKLVSVRLVSYEAPKKVAVVKEIRAITALGLKESKELVEEAPKIVKKGVPVSEAEQIKKKLEAAGATVQLE